MRAYLCGVFVFLCVAFATAQQRPSELSGYIKNRNNSPIKGVVVNVGSFNVATDANGYYKLTALKPGLRIVSLAPPEKASRSFKVMVETTPTRKDFVVDW